MTPKKKGILFALETSFLLLIFSLGFMQPSVEARGLTLPFTDMLFILTFILWGVALVRRVIDVQFDGIYILFALYALGMLLSVVFSQNLAVSITKYLGELYLIGLALMTVNLVRSLEMLKKVIFAWLIASAVAAGVGALAVAFFYLGYSNFITDFALHHFGSLPPGNYPRIQGTFHYPSLFCNYLTVSLLMLFAARKLDWIGRALFAVLGTVIGIAVAFTVTPGISGVLLGIAIWVALLLRAQGRPTLSKLAMSGGTLAVTGLLVVSTITLISDPTSPYRFNPHRPLIWQSAFQTFLEYPFFGKGVGLGVAEVIFYPPSGGAQLLTDAHNTLLSVAAQAGLVAAIPLLLICIAVVRQTLPLKFGDGATSIMRLCFGVAFVSAFLCQGIVGSFEDTRHLWVLIGLIIATNNLAGSGTSGGK